MNVISQRDTLEELTLAPRGYPLDDLRQQRRRWEHPSVRTFWHSLDAAEREALATCAEERIFWAGTALCRQDHSTTEVMVIRSGWAKVSMQFDHQERIIAWRTSGDVVGERATLSAAPRSATVVAVNDVCALVISADRFRARLDDRAPAHDRRRGGPGEDLSRGDRPDRDTGLGRVPDARPSTGATELLDLRDGRRPLRRSLPGRRRPSDRPRDAVPHPPRGVRRVGGSVGHLCTRGPWRRHAHRRSPRGTDHIAGRPADRVACREAQAVQPPSRRVGPDPAPGGVERRTGLS